MKAELLKAATKAATVMKEETLSSSSKYMELGEDYLLVLKESILDDKVSNSDNMVICIDKNDESSREIAIAECVIMSRNMEPKHCFKFVTYKLQGALIESNKVRIVDGFLYIGVRFSGPDKASGVSYFRWEDDSYFDSKIDSLFYNNRVKLINSISRFFAPVQYIELYNGTAALMELDNIVKNLDPVDIAKLTEELKPIIEKYSKRLINKEV